MIQLSHDQDGLVETQPEEQPLNPKPGMDREPAACYLNHLWTDLDPLSAKPLYTADACST